jgi:NADH-quinone oxidoreductase subunit L
MHGLRKYMPVTHWTFLIGCLAIAGIIPFSGFFSKDEILSACAGYDWLAYAWMSMVAGLTAFYMFRLYYLIFWWKEHKIPEGHHAPHDQPWTMSLPLIILAAVSCVAGFIPFGKLVSWNGEPYDFMAHFDWSVAGVSLTVAVLAILLATVMYRKENSLPEKFRQAVPDLWRWCFHRFYWDELYMFITHKIIFNGVCRPIAWFDRHIIDGTMDSFAAITNKASELIRPLQSGQIQYYVWVYLIGALLLGVITALCLI